MVRYPHDEGPTHGCNGLPQRRCSYDLSERVEQRFAARPPGTIIGRIGSLAADS